MEASQLISEWPEGVSYVHKCIYMYVSSNNVTIPIRMNIDDIDDQL